MNSRLFIIIGLVVIILIAIFFGLNPERLKLDDIQRIEICNFPECTTGKTLDQDAMKTFVKAYNGVKTYNNSYSTTHDYRITITFKDGETMDVWGGTQGFQTVKQDGHQFNIQGARLLTFFKSFDCRLGK